MIDATKNILNQALIPILAAAAGSWFGANTAIARMDERINSLESSVKTLEVRLSAVNDPIQGPMVEHREFRERIAKIEARQEQVMLRLRMKN